MEQNITQPPPPPPYSGQSEAVTHISNYLVPSILVTLFCCLPLGIPAIVFAAQVNGKVQAGDIQGAQESSRKAKMFCWISFAAGLVFGLAYFLLMMLGVAAEMGNM
ncbi:MAG TPA: CD225/dispanin family protein [bacterium]|nr:CD225/dispanin family protein [bacterium]